MKRTNMKKIKEILRLSCLEGLSLRQISKAVSVSRPAISKYINAFNVLNMRYDEIKNLNEDRIIELLFGNPKDKDNNKRYADLSEKFEYFAKEIKKKNVTLQKLWEEYIEENPDGYSRSQFCEHFNSWRRSCEITMHIEHKAGEKMFVDFAGKKLNLTDKKTGELLPVEVFVAILPASHYTFVCAVKSLKTADWIRGSEEAFWYFGGTPKVITPDCFKSAVKKFDRYNPEINPGYSRFAEHYNVAVVPARPAHPKDKALVENAVKIVYSRIYAGLRNDVFYSLEELNRAILIELEKYNSRKMQNTKLSRIELFNSTEKNVLNNLPKDLYENKKYTKSKIHSNYHVFLNEDKKYYSVPFKYFAESRKTKVDIYYTDASVEIYFKNERISVHKRDYSSKSYITNTNHLPLNHKAFLERLNPEKTIALAKSKGRYVEELLNIIIAEHKIPEQSYYCSKGFIKLAKIFGKDRLDKACKRSISLGICEYKAVFGILKNNLENIDEKSMPNEENIPQNNDVRGKEYFKKKLKGYKRG